MKIADREPGLPSDPLTENGRDTLALPQMGFPILLFKLKFKERTQCYLFQSDFQVDDGLFLDYEKERSTDPQSSAVFTTHKFNPSIFPMPRNGARSI